MDKQTQQDLDEASFEALFLVEGTRARAPNLDLQDDDVFDLGQVEQTAQILDAPDDDEMVEDLPPTGDRGVWDQSGRVAAVPPSPAVAERTWTRTEKLVIAFSAVNALVIGALLLLPAVLEESGGEAPMPTPAPVVAAGSSVAIPGDGVPASAHPLQPGVTVSGDESAQQCIDRGEYSRAATLLRAHLAAHPGLSSLQRRAVFSSLAYCADRLGQTEAAFAYTARVEALRQLAATPAEVWSEADAARGKGDTAAARRGFARLLLRQDHWNDGGIAGSRVGTAMAAIGDAHREDGGDSVEGER